MSFGLYRPILALLFAVAAGSPSSHSLASSVPPRLDRRVAVADFAWLAGRWVGHIAGSTAEAETTFLPPKAGLMVGMMRLVDQGQVLVVELISLIDTPNGPELRFRHFSPVLDAQEMTFKQNMRLTKHADDRDVFENLTPFDKTLVSTEPRVATYIHHGNDELIAHADILDSQGNASVIEVSYHRVP